MASFPVRQSPRRAELGRAVPFSGRKNLLAAARPRVQLGIARASSAAIDRPPPKSGEVLHTALPDTFDGIRFEIGRMEKYVRAAQGDPFLADFVAGICGTHADMAAESAQMKGEDISALSRNQLGCEALDEWCRTHYAYVNDPPNIEVIQTPARMVKQTMIPTAVLRDLLEPFYEEFANANPSYHVEGYEPPALYFGDCDEAVTAYLGLCANIPRQPLEMGAPSEPSIGLAFRFGGNDGTLHHVWGRVNVDGKDIDADHTEPGFRFGDFSQFEAYEEHRVEVPA